MDASSKEWHYSTLMVLAHFRGMALGAWTNIKPASGTTGEFLGCLAGRLQLHLAYSSNPIRPLHWN